MEFTYNIKVVNDFTDDELLVILQDAVKHMSNPKHICSSFDTKTQALVYELVGYRVIQVSPEDIDRLDSLVKGSCEI